MRVVEAIGTERVSQLLDGQIGNDKDTFLEYDEDDPAKSLDYRTIPYDFFRDKESSMYLSWGLIKFFYS